MRTLLKGLVAAGALLVMLIAGGVLYLSTLDFNEYNDEIETAITDATGRQFRIAGNTTLDVLPDPKVVFERVSLANAEWGTKPEFVSVERLEAEISLVGLLGGELWIKQVALVPPQYFSRNRCRRPEKLGHVAWRTGIRLGAGRDRTHYRGFVPRGDPRRQHRIPRRRHGQHPRPRYRGALDQSKGMAAARRHRVARALRRPPVRSHRRDRDVVHPDKKRALCVRRED